MVSSPGFGSVLCYTMFRAFGTRFPYASPGLLVRQAAYDNSPVHSSIGTTSLSLTKALSVCPQTVSGSISLSVPLYFSPFPHGTSSLSVFATYLALEDGSPRFPQSIYTGVLGILLEVKEN